MPEFKSRDTGVVFGMSGVAGIHRTGSVCEIHSMCIGQSMQVIFSIYQDRGRITDVGPVVGIGSPDFHIGLAHWCWRQISVVFKQFRHSMGGIGY